MPSKALDSANPIQLRHLAYDSIISNISYPINHSVRSLDASNVPYSPTIDHYVRWPGLCSVSGRHRSILPYAPMLTVWPDTA